jgi:ABC-2 type transport system permease protein
VLRYWALVRTGFRRYATYRAATLAGLFVNTVFGFIRAAVLVAAIDAAGGIAGYDRTDALTYAWLTQALIMAIAVWQWIELAVRIRTGDVVTDLQRPVDLQGAYLADDLGRAGYQVLARGLPPFCIGALVYDLRVPTHIGPWLAFAASLFLAVIVSFGLRFIANLLAFWVLDYRGINAMSSLLTTLLSGFAVPIAFFPDWAARVLIVLPWASMVQIPIDVFLGRVTGTELAGALALQTTWAVALLLLGRRVLAAATRRVVVQGG